MSDLWHTLWKTLLVRIHNVQHDFFLGLGDTRGARQHTGRSNRREKKKGKGKRSLKENKIVLVHVCDRGGIADPCPSDRVEAAPHML